jgi:hypothetical protein
MPQASTPTLHARLASAITVVIATAHEGGIPLEIRLPAAGTLSVVETTPAPNAGWNLPDLARMPDIEQELLLCLARVPHAHVTLTEFATYKGMSEETVRGQLRGGGRSAFSVADDLYERFDTVRPEGLEDGTYRKVRTYRLTARGRAFVKTL